MFDTPTRLNCPPMASAPRWKAGLPDVECRPLQGNMLRLQLEAIRTHPCYLLEATSADFIGAHGAMEAHEKPIQINAGFTHIHYKSKDHPRPSRTRSFAGLNIFV